MAFLSNERDRKLRHFSPMLLDLQTFFLQIRTLAEAKNIETQDLKDIQLISKHALATLDYALFAVDMMQTELPLTPISAAASARDVADSLRQLAVSYNVELELDATTRLEPVYANEAALRGAIYGLASSLITSRRATSKRVRVVIATQETKPKTQRIGVYSPDVPIGTAAVKSARELIGKAKAVAPGEIHGGGVGLVISDQLTQIFGSELKLFTHRGYKGLGFYVQQSTQLSIL